MGARLYKHRANVRAERVEDQGTVHTGTGPVTANAGDYLVYTDSGITTLVSGEEFERDYEEIGDEADAEEYASEKSEKETTEKFDPAEHTIPDVLKYLDSASQDERQRVFDLESIGENRKGILDKRKEYDV